MTAKIKEQRKHIRYDIDQGSAAAILLHQEQDKLISLRGLIINSSYGGFELLLITPNVIAPGQEMEIRLLEQGLTDLGVFDASVIWTKQIDPNIYKVGVQYN